MTLLSRIAFLRSTRLSYHSITPGFKAKTRCSLYVCLGSSCHTYVQNMNTKNKCLYYINFITQDLVFKRILDDSVVE
jgi:hypothetical protein